MTNVNEPSLETLLSYIDDGGIQTPPDSIDLTAVFGEDKIFQDNDIYVPEDNSDIEPDPIETSTEDTSETKVIQTSQVDNVVSNQNTGSDLDSNSSGNPKQADYKDYYSILEDNGLLYTDEEFKFDGSADSLAEAIKQTSSNLQGAVFNAFWEKLPEEWRPALQYALNGGTDIKAYLETFQSPELSNLDINGSTDAQRKVLREYYKATTKYNTDKIENMINRLDVLGVMEEEAISAMSELSEIEQTNRVRLADEQRQTIQAQELAVKQRRDNISGLIDSYEAIPQNRKGKVKAFIFNQVQNEGGEPDTQFNKTLQHMANNEEHFVQLADFLLDSYDPKKGFNFERYIKKGVTSSNKSIKEKLESLSTKTNVTGGASKISNSDFNLDLWLSQN